MMRRVLGIGDESSWFVYRIEASAEDAEGEDFGEEDA